MTAKDFKAEFLKMMENWNALGFKLVKIDSTQLYLVNDTNYLNLEMFNESTPFDTDIDLEGQSYLPGRLDDLAGDTEDLVQNVLKLHRNWNVLDVMDWVYNETDKYLLTKDDMAFKDLMDNVEIEQF